MTPPPTQEPVGDALTKVTASLPGGGEDRPGQRRMAEAVEEALVEHHHLIVQAGTGTGKSLAYLVPSALLGKPVVVATATKALQEQLASRDLPLVASALGDVVVAVLKGRTNYLCRQRTAELEERGFQASLAEDGESGPAGERLVPQLQRLMSFERSTASGDRADLPEAVSDRAWSMVSVSARECPGKFSCPQGERCFTEMARAHAAEADVIVINLHLLGAHLASGGQVLPDYGAVVIDEVHELEEVMTQSLGVELTANRFRTIASSSRSLLKGESPKAQATAVADAGEGLGLTLAEHDEGEELHLSHAENLATSLTLCDAALRGLLAELRKLPEDEPAGPRAVSAATRALEDVGRLRGASDDEVLWVSGPKSARSLNLSPIDVSAALKEGLFGASPVVMTSATVPLGIERRLGLDEEEVKALDVGSPFDFRRQSILYVPTDLGDRRAEGAEERIAEEISALINAAGGRTLALFTSRRALNEAADRVANQVTHPLLVQGASTNRALIEDFRDHEDACLFATMGMWQGLDIQGPSLSLVTIDRLPFGRPDDPLLEARRRRAGSGAFMSVDVPRAATLLAQGVGRLIRSATDRGVVAVLDDRLAKAGYRNALLNALPDMKRSIDRLEVLSFLREIAADAD